MNRLLIPLMIALIVWVSVCLADPTPLPPDPQILALVNQLNQANLTATVSSLVGFHTRHTFSDTVSTTRGIGAARNWMLGQFNQAGAQAQFFPWTTYYGGNPNYLCKNVNGIVPGSSNRLVILGGHLDSRPANGNDVTSFAPGADDDGSSVSFLLETARILAGQSLTATVISAAFTGEEQGLYGSEFYAGYLDDNNIPVTGMINLDMIGHIRHPSGGIDSTTVRCFSGDQHGSGSRQLSRYVKWVGESYSPGLTVALQPAIDRPGRGGDHMPFDALGYPACRLIETAEDVAYQHNVTDVPENMSFSYVLKVARLALGAATALSKAPPAPVAPVVVNYGNGTGVNVWWPDSLVQPGDVMYLAYRAVDQLYWENVIALPASPPEYVGSLDSGCTYEFSLSLSLNGNYKPSLFGDEAEATIIAAPAPEGFDSESTPSGVHLNWQPRTEPNVFAYLIERAIPGGEFQFLGAVPHPISEYFNGNLQPGQQYLYHVRTVMAGGLTGAPTPVQEGQLATHDRGLLLVDATVDGPGLPNAPTDAQVDSFYAAQTSAWQVAGQWDRIDSLAVGVTLSDADLAPYDVALVYADYFNGNMAADTTALRKYRNNGGKLLVTGWRLSNVVMGSNAYAHHYGPGDFLYDLAGIDSIRVTTPPAQFIGTMGQAGYPNLMLDPAVYPVGLLFAESAWTDIFPPSVQVVGTFNSNQGAASPFHGKAVAWKGYSPQISWVLVDAPLFFMTGASAAAFLQQALTDLGAPPNAVLPGETTAPFAFRLDPPRPNPFNGRAVASFELRVPSLVRLTVWDTAGRLVQTLVKGWKQAGLHQAEFDGKGLASGVYLIRLEAGRERATGKVVMVK